MPYQQQHDIQLYYEIHGEGAPVLLLHGLGSTAQDWELQVPLFAQKYQVVTVDVRGHGRSTKPAGPYSIPQFAADIATFCDALHLQSVHLLGISMGGMIAFQMAMDRPDLLRSLIIVNSYPEVVARNWQDRVTWYRRHVIIRLFGMKRLGAYLGKSLFPELHQAELQQTLAERWLKNDKQAYLASMQAIYGWSMADRLGDIHCPTLIITADQDYTSVASKEAYTAKIPDARLIVIPNSRHATPVDQPEQFNKAVLAFWETINK